MKSVSFLLLVLTAIVVDHAQSTLPGFQIKLSAKGLDYANSVAHAVLGKELTTLKIPDQSGSAKHTEWSLTSIENQGCTVPSSNMAFAPTQNGLTWAIENLGINLHAHWRAKYKKGWVKVSTSGTVDVKVERASVRVTVSLVQKGGRPAVSMANCASSIGNVDVRFHGGEAFIYNLFRHTVGDKIKDIMQKQICSIVQKEINTDANAQLSKMKVTVEMDHRFLLDYSLVSNPKVNAGDLTLQHKGETFWKEDKKEAPFTPKPIPPSSDVSRMMYLWVTDYMANTFMYSAQQHGYLQYNLSKNDFPPGNASFLNTTCSLFCIGKFIPQIGKQYPNRQVIVQAKSLSAPNLTITAKGASLTTDIITDLYALTQDSKDSAYLLTLRLALSMSVTGSIVNERMIGKITDHNVQVTVVKSSVGNISSLALNLVLKGAFSLAVIPKLNSFLAVGVDLPVTGSLAFQNTQLSLLNGSVVIATDIQYKPSSSSLTVVSEKHLV